MATIDGNVKVGQGQAAAVAETRADPFDPKLGAVIYYPDPEGIIQLTDAKTQGRCLVYSDGSLYRWKDGKGWGDESKQSASTRARTKAHFEKYAAYAPATLASVFKTSPRVAAAGQQVAPKAKGDVVAKSPQTLLGDVNQKLATLRAKLEGATPDNAEKIKGRIDDLERDAAILSNQIRLEQQNKALSATASSALAMAKDAKGKIDKAEAEAKAVREAPSFRRALIDIFQFLAGWMTPLVHLASLVGSVIRIGYMLATGRAKDIDWIQEGAYTLGYIAGCFWPPVGAVATAGLNIYYNESRLLGGINDAFDDANHDDGEHTKNWFRETAVDVWNTVTGWFGFEHEENKADEGDAAPVQEPAPAEAVPLMVEPAPFKLS